MALLLQKPRHFHFKGPQWPHGAVLQSDGYSAYQHYTKKAGITQAQCWAHARRKILNARDFESAKYITCLRKPDLAAETASVRS